MACEAFHALLTSNQGALNPTAFRILRIDLEIFDEGGKYDPVAFGWTPSAGIVTVKGCVSMSVVGSANFTVSGIFKNGVIWKKGSVVTGSGSQNNQRSVVSVVDQADGTDFYQLVVRHNGPAATIAFSNARLTYFSGAQQGRQCFPTDP